MERWSELTIAKQAKQNVSEPLYGAKSLIKLSRVSVRRLVYIYTGHAPLHKHLFTIGKVDSPLCPKCGEEYDTTYHYVGRCQWGNYWYHRKQYLNEFTANSDIIRTAHRKDLLAYLRATGRFTY